MKTFVRVTGHVQGFHCWPAAPAEVDFLRASHRHIFHWRVEVLAKHDDRQLEFFILKAAVARCFVELGVVRTDAAMHVQGLDFGSKSCEMLAKGVGEMLVKAGLPVHEVVVGEDDENEAVVVFA